IASKSKPLQHVKEGWIHQPLDHFNRQNAKTFTQRFFVNEAYWQRPDGPVFLFIGGEGPIYNFDVLAGHHVDMAKEHRALLLSVEHRFYGDSINPDGLKTENLADLSSQQALADLAAFHQYISQSFNLSSRNTWISFGGSYSGSLSAWFRGKFPNLVYGAVASSAPVKAKLDFAEYSNVRSLYMSQINAPTEHFAHTSFLQMELMQNLADIIMGSVQYNEEGVLMSIKELCGVMTKTSHNMYHSNSDESCLDISHEKTVKELKDVSHKNRRRAERQWTYQTCTEFGFYQTCEDTTCPFSGMVTLQAQTKICSKVFGISQHSLPSRIAFTNSYYGGDNPNTYRVLYVNGGVDPWKELSVVQDSSEGSQTVFIKDTAHCADMSKERLTDRHSLREARQEIENHVASWLRTAALEKMTKSGA
uniref:Serine protease 16 n=1 Tax=Xiphophorus couchianus TaxID=32473 RepID=A0A3B5L4H9_9TELE